MHAQVNMSAIYFGHAHGLKASKQFEDGEEKLVHDTSTDDTGPNDELL